MTEILLVRHGQSVWNAQGRWQGQADPPLSSLGLEQASAAADYLTTQEAFDAVVTSALVRAATTATIIADRLGHDEPFESQDLVERNAGEWSGLTRSQIEAGYPGYLKARKFPPGYEHDEHLFARIQLGIGDVVVKLEGERLLAIVHSGVIYCIERTLGLSFKHLSNLGGRWIGVDKDVNFTLGPRVDLLTDFAGEHTTPTSM